MKHIYLNRYTLLIAIASLFIFSAQNTLKAGSTDIKTGFQRLSVSKMSATAKNIKATDLFGKTVELKSLKGKVVFLNVWATWCPPCRREMPHMQKLYNSMKNKNFAMIAISRESKSTVKNFVKSKGYTFPVATIKGFPNQYGTRGIPTTFIIDKNGNLIGKAVGSRNWASDDSVKLFKALVESKEKMKTVDTASETEDKTFSDNKLGLEFNYPDNYNIAMNKNKGGFHELQVKSDDATANITMQIFSRKINSKNEKIFIDTVTNQMILKKFKKISSRTKTITLPIKLKFKAHAPKASVYHLVFRSPDNVKLIFNIYIFSAGSRSKRGFVISFIQAGKKKRKAEFAVIKNSFTLLH